MAPTLTVTLTSPPPPCTSEGYHAKFKKLRQYIREKFDVLIHLFSSRMTTAITFPASSPARSWAHTTYLLLERLGVTFTTNGKRQIQIEKLSE